MPHSNIDKTSEDCALPIRESLRHRATALGALLRLCSFCLRSSTTCGDCQRRGSGRRSWKRRRSNQRRRVG
jgi:hypothetical protein